MTHSLRADGFDASEDGTGRGTPIVPAIVPQAMSSKWAKGSSGPAGDEIANLVAEPIAFHGSQDPDISGDVTHPLGRNQGQEVAVAIPFDTTQMTSAAIRSAPKAGDPSHPLAAGAHPPAIAFTTKDHGADAADEVAPTMRAMGFDGSHANGGGQLGVAMTVFDSKDMTLGSDGASSTLTTNGESGKAGGRLAFASSWAVRRLTPVECARLQGFPDDYLTSVSYRGKPPADGPMYRALGNSMAVNVVRVMGERIEMVDAQMRAAGRW